MNDDMNKRRDELADKRSKRQCTTGNQDLDKAIAWYLKIGFEDGFDAGVAEMQAQTTNALKFLRDRVVGYQASRNVFRVIDEEIKKYDHGYEPQTSSRQRKQFVANRNNLIQELRTERDTLKQALDLAVCGILAIKDYTSLHEQRKEKWDVQYIYAIEQKINEALTSINEIINKTKQASLKD